MALVSFPLYALDAVPDALHPLYRFSAWAPAVVAAAEPSRSLGRVDKLIVAGPAFLSMGITRERDDVWVAETLTDQVASIRDKVAGYARVASGEDLRRLLGEIVERGEFQ